MIVILGESASGKTTLLNNFIKNNPKYHKIITYTTRPMRVGEVNGVDYHFISQEAFDEFVKRDFFVEHNNYRGWSYGTAKEDCRSKNGIAILTPAGFRALKKLGYKTTSIYVSVDRVSRLVSILLRGDDVDEAYRRNLSDLGQFDAIGQEVDYIIDNDKYHMNEEMTVKCMEAIIEEVQNKAKRNFKK